ncbi:MAG TPA: hypothetical protein PK328_08035, partial [Chitinophagaceae bacterium]|nr:hypothetical protein [Chitinophagaceae bacterium]
SLSVLKKKCHFHAWLIIFIPPKFKPALPTTIGNKTEYPVKITGSNCGNPHRMEIKSAPSA